MPPTEKRDATELLVMCYMTTADNANLAVMHGL